LSEPSKPNSGRKLEPDKLMPDKKLEPSVESWSGMTADFSLGLQDEMKAPAVAEMMATFWMTTILSFATKLGSEESMSVVGPALERIGVAKAESMKKVLPPFEKNALGFAKWSNGWEEMMGIEGEIVEASPERVVKVITKCPIAEEKGASPLICDLFSCSLKGAGSVIAPGFMFYQTHNPMKGDKYCRWVIERVKE
jgi:hypothetical protein